ncbi:MAG: hypothetical protein ACKV19_14275 [Verrucomicrobiales bacterium]
MKTGLILWFVFVLTVAKSHAISITFSGPGSTDAFSGSFFLELPGTGISDVQYDEYGNGFEVGEFTQVDQPSGFYLKPYIVFRPLDHPFIPNVLFGRLLTEDHTYAPTHAKPFRSETDFAYITNLEYQPGVSLSGDFRFEPQPLTAPESVYSLALMSFCLAGLVALRRLNNLRLPTTPQSR